ncbi:UvrD-like helicase C-terminal domain containing protein, putative [Angomonas deanei]|uniref:UvrD-like helicase C-terminal domain containing protein, putative n=1 Tax=Angomonas deanei TaxID=59799 RepID=A0A7G2CJZ4_9TRYP|nr:UvrD-like helicase C-terminal domain containing protein, putative [Angomonas deanei]
MEEEEEEVSLTQLLLSTLDKTVLFMMDEIGAEEEVEGKTPAVCTPGTVLWRLVDQFTELSEEDSLAGVKIKNAASAAASHNTSPHRSSGVTVESSGKVTVGTVHAAKGLEWPCVLLTDCNCGGFPLRVRNVQSKVFKEEKRIFYVALSRAKFDLFCLTATDGEKSPFVEEISAHLTPLSVEDIFCEYAPY